MENANLTLLEFARVASSHRSTYWLTFILGIITLFNFFYPESASACKELFEDDGILHFAIGWLQAAFVVSSIYLLPFSILLLVFFVFFRKLYDFACANTRNEPSDNYIEHFRIVIYEKLIKGPTDNNRPGLSWFSQTLVIYSGQLFRIYLIVVMTSQLSGICNILSYLTADNTLLTVMNTRIFLVGLFQTFVVCGKAVLYDYPAAEYSELTKRLEQ